MSKPESINPVDKLFYTPEQATGPLEMGIDAVEAWMASGHLKYAVEKERGKRRIWWEDMVAFGKWYREEYMACPSTLQGTRTAPRKAGTGNMTSRVVAVDFADRSTVRAAGLALKSSDQKKRPSARKRSLELRPRPNNEGAPG